MNDNNKSNSSQSSTPKKHYNNARKSYKHTNINSNNNNNNNKNNNSNNNIGNSPKSVPAAVLTPNANRRIAGTNWNAAMMSNNNNNNNKNLNENQNQKIKSIVAPSVAVAAANATIGVAVQHHQKHAVGQQQQQQRHHVLHHNNQQHHHHNKQQRHNHHHNTSEYIAMDCEMVGIGFQGRDDMLARVSIVNKSGKVLLDKYVKPVEIISDYRTPVSGIRPKDLVDAYDFLDVQEQVRKILKDNILVGHNIQKDLQVLKITHPHVNIRDTSNYKPLARLVSNGRTPSLKRLCAKILGTEIQNGEHNSVEDARAAMNIYNVVANDWEAYLAKKHYGHR